MQIVSIPTGQPIIAGKPFIATGILRVAKPPNPNPLAGQTVVFFCNACSPIIKDSTTTIKDGSYTFRVTAPNQAAIKLALQQHLILTVHTKIQTPAGNIVNMYYKRCK